VARAATEFLALRSCRLPNYPTQAKLAWVGHPPDPVALAKRPVNHPIELSSRASVLCAAKDLGEPREQRRKAGVCCENLGEVLFFALLHGGVGE